MSEEYMSLDAATAAAGAADARLREEAADRLSAADQVLDRDTYFAKQVREFGVRFAARARLAVAPESVYKLEWIKVPQPSVRRGFHRYTEPPKDAPRARVLYSGWSFRLPTWHGPYDDTPRVNTTTVFGSRDDVGTTVPVSWMLPMFTVSTEGECYLTTRLLEPVPIDASTPPVSPLPTWGCLVGDDKSGLRQGHLLRGTGQRVSSPAQVASHLDVRPSAPSFELNESDYAAMDQYRNEETTRLHLEMLSWIVRGASRFLELHGLTWE